MVLLVRPLLSFKRLKCAEDLYLYIFERRGMKRQQTLRRENKINVHVIDFPLACAGQCVCLWMMLLPWTASPCFAAASAFPPLWRSFVACPKNWIQGVGRWGAWCLRGLCGLWVLRSGLNWAANACAWFICQLIGVCAKVLKQNNWDWVATILYPPARSSQFAPSAAWC